MKRRYLILLGLLSFVVALLLYAPVASLYAWLGPKGTPAVVSLSGIDGTFMTGQASSLQLRGRPLVQGVNWSMQPLSLLWGRATYHLQSRDPQLLFEAQAGSGLGGTRIQDLKLNGGLRAVMAAAGQPFLPVDGQLGLDLERLHLKDGWPTRAEGQLRLVNLAWALARDPVALGDYEATLTPDGKDITVLVTTLSGPLDLNGDGRLYPDRRYELHLQLKPKPDAPPMVVNLVRSLGAADAQGYHHLRYQGQQPAPAAKDAAAPAAATGIPGIPGLPAAPAPTR